MTKSKKAAVLWFLAGAALLLGGLLSDPSRPLGIVGGILLFAVGILSLLRGNPT